MPINGEVLSEMPLEDWECDEDEDGSTPSKKVASITEDADLQKIMDDFVKEGEEFEAGPSSIST